MSSPNYVPADIEAMNARQAATIKLLRAALEKIADWNGSWGPFPEGNPAWCSMAIVTAREAIKALDANPGVKP